MNITSEQKRAALDKLESRAFRFSVEVEPLYKKLKWTWTPTAGVPNQKHIYWAIKSLIARIRELDVDEVQSGGLYIKFDNNGAYLGFSKEYAVFWDETT